MISFDKLPETMSRVASSLEFAGVVTLTRLAWKSRAALQQVLSQKFKLRNKWTQSGIRVTPANMQTKEAEVYSRDWYIAQHEEGKRRVRPSEGPFQIPGEDLYDVAGISDEKPIPKSKRADSILNRNVKGSKPFTLPMRGNKRGVFLRTGGELNLLYTLQDQPVKIDKKPWFMGTVEDTYEKNFDDVYDKSVSEALERTISKL